LAGGSSQGQRQRQGEKYHLNVETGRDLEAGNDDQRGAGKLIHCPARRNKYLKSILGVL
jgi:hypothetical protein